MNLAIVLVLAADSYQKAYRSAHGCFDFVVFDTFWRRRWLSDLAPSTLHLTLTLEVRLNAFALTLVTRHGYSG